jgi:hypothetical protein
LDGFGGGWGGHGHGGSFRLEFRVSRR